LHSKWLRTSPCLTPRSDEKGALSPLENVILQLKVNTDKSKIMIFNSNGKTYLNQFTYNNVDIVTVANYCYLRMVLKFNGNFNLAINTLMKKARKAYFEHPPVLLLVQMKKGH
jgi:hypothetical protein